jgi:hypothetical protein
MIQVAGFLSLRIFATFVLQGFSYRIRIVLLLLQPLDLSHPVDLIMFVLPATPMARPR